MPYRTPHPATSPPSSNGMTPSTKLGYGNAPDNDFVIRQRRRAIDAWTAGDPSISETAIYEMIAREMTNTAATIDADELRLYLTLKEKSRRPRSLKRAKTNPASE